MQLSNFNLGRGPKMRPYNIISILEREKIVRGTRVDKELPNLNEINSINFNLITKQLNCSKHATS